VFLVAGNAITSRIVQIGAGAAGAYSFDTNSGNLALINGSVLGFSAAGGFSPTSTLPPNMDVGLSRIATALLEVNNGNVGGVGSVAFLRFNAVVTASLPAASVTYRGARGTVSDANATLTAGIGAVVAGGGANIVPVFCDGTNWRIG
jgi:hypothetical protein